MSHAAHIQSAVYAGSFDPLTNGHMDLIRRAASLTHTLFVAVGNNPRKRYLFSVEDRSALLQGALADLPNIVVQAFDGLLINFCRQVGATVIFRGLRAVADFEYEFQMGLANKDLAPEIETLFLLTNPELLFVSSSIVKEIAAGGCAVERYVPPTVAAALYARLGVSPSQSPPTPTAAT
jgi:pantetheine-phosphate adenylyltransferase